MDNTIWVTIGQLVLAGIVGAGSAMLTVGKLFQRVTHLEEDNKANKSEIKEIRDKAIACETRLKEREPLGKRRSPLALSERGVGFLKNSGGETFVDDNYATLRDAVDALNPQTSYDVQEVAKKVIENLRNDDRLNPLKEWLFKDGSTLEDLFFVMSIHLRDKILREKGWNVEDIDNHPVVVGQ